MGLSWIRSCWLAWSARPLSSAQDLRCKAGLGTRPQPREPPSCRAQWEAGAWHGYGALQVSRSPSQPQQLDPGGEQDSPGSLLAAEPRGTCRAREKYLWHGREVLQEVSYQRRAAPLHRSGMSSLPHHFGAPHCCPPCPSFHLHLLPQQPNPRGGQLCSAMQHLQQDKVVYGRLHIHSSPPHPPLWGHCVCVTWLSWLLLKN